MKKNNKKYYTGQTVEEKGTYKVDRYKKRGKGSRGNPTMNEQSMKLERG